MPMSRNKLVECVGGDKHYDGVCITSEARPNKSHAWHRAAYHAWNQAWPFEIRLQSWQTCCNASFAKSFGCVFVGPNEPHELELYRMAETVGDA